jgi:phosphoenolpyruvate synthase/pyruvate phosphate dikinase
VIRRRAEREKLATIEMPAIVDGDWQPVTAPAHSLSELSGNGVSRGVVRGPVRLLADPDDGLEPGEVLVCRVTDVGWTPLFAAAAAVVSEIGGSMSHTAVVAREFGIPAVVGVDMATYHLCDGQVVEVDGDAGTIRVLDNTVGAEQSSLKISDSAG